MLLRTALAIAGLGMSATSFSFLSGTSLAHNNAVHSGASAKSSAKRGTTYPAPAGTRTYYRYDSNCLNGGEPDDFAVYVEWWNEDNSFDHDVYAGHSTYYCDTLGGSYEVGQDISTNYYFTYCEANSPPQWNCQELGEVYDYHP